MYKLKVWDEEDELGLPKTIGGNEFLNFLELCFQEATYFSLNKAVWENSTNANVEKELKPFLVKTLDTLKWFGYDFSLAPEEDRRKMRVNIYGAEKVVKDILYKYFSDIFLRTFNNGVLSNSSQTLEDLCFLTTEEIFVGTVSHEYILEVFPPNEKFEQTLKQFGQWNYYNNNPIKI